MILALDVGNTGAKFALAARGEITRAGRVPLVELQAENCQLGLASDEWSAIERVVACSVNPSALEAAKEIIGRRSSRPVQVVGVDFPPGIRARVERPGAVGADRLMNALGAHHLVGGACFIVDFGSALTVDVVSEAGDFLGGTIACGLGMSAQALAEQTAFLPLLEPTRPEAALGKDTVSAMRSGLYYGHAGMADRLVEMLAKEVGWPQKILATGGDARLLAPASSHIDEVRPNLTLEGLLIAAGEARRQ